MHQFNFDAGDERTVYPFLGGDSAGLADDSAQIALRQTEAVGVIADLVLFMTVLVDELDKTVKNGLFT